MWSAQEIFIEGLRNAHAMERQAEELLKRQCERTGDYPDVQRQLRQHLEETRVQIGRLDHCLASLGQSSSALKDAALSLMGNIAAAGNALAGDEILRNMFANQAFENYEIAAYKSLLVLAARVEAAEATALLERSLHEEQAMAKWVEDHLDEVTLAYVARQERRAA
jgi:ferritin-like metal-binding protein YciE